MEINYIRLHDDAVEPTRSHDSDAGLDLYNCEAFELWPGCQAEVRTGIALDIPHGYVGLVWPRSGMAFHHGIDTLAGVVDAGFHGEIKISLINHGMHQQNYPKKCRVAQILIQKIELVTLFKLHNEDGSESKEFWVKSERGVAGYGSTHR